MRWAVHSEPARSIVAELPCQPHVQVIVWAWCLYSSITCLNGSLAMAGLTGGRLFNARTPARCARGARRGVLTLPDLAESCSEASAGTCPERGPKVSVNGLFGAQVVPESARQPAHLAQHCAGLLAAFLERLAPHRGLPDQPRAEEPCRFRRERARRPAIGERDGQRRGVGPLHRSCREDPATDDGRTNTIAAVAMAVVDRPAVDR